MTTEFKSAIAAARADGYKAGVLSAGMACGDSIVEYVRTTNPDASPLRLQVLRVRMEGAAKALLSEATPEKLQQKIEALKPIDLYRRRGHLEDEANAHAFCEISNRYPEIGFYWPNKAKAPWHLQAQNNGLIVNFWPHRMKACLDGGRTVEGPQKVESLILELIAHRDVDVIE